MRLLEGGFSEDFDEDVHWTTDFRGTYTGQHAWSAQQARCIWSPPRGAAVCTGADVGLGLVVAPTQAALGGMKIIREI